MRILLIHNFYQQPGGEDGVFRAEKALLASHGHDVATYTDHNDRVAEVGKLTLLTDTLWSRSSYRKITKILNTFQPEVVHCHNTFPLISPAVYHACARHGVPVVQTLHNFRLLCSNALFFRDGAVCELCLGKSLPWPAVRHACYRQSRSQSAVVALLLSAHRLLGTWQRQVTRYIALTEFSRQKMIAGGLPAEKITVKPNFMEDPLNGVSLRENPRSGALFVGRLSPEKGLDTLLQAFRELPDVPLSVVGDGPLSEMVQTAAEQSPNILYLGRQPKEQVLQRMQQAALLIFPSQWYETFGLVAIEAFACGTPVLASNLGAMAEIVRDRETGFHFPPGDAAALAATVRRALSDPQALREMGRRARETYLAHYTPEKNYAQLMAIYREAIAAVRKTVPPA